MRKEYQYPAIYVNKERFALPYLMVGGMKTIETRRLPTLDRFIGKRVGILSPAYKGRLLVGFVDIIGKKEYNSKEEFDKDCFKHYVFPDSKYYFTDKKVGYILANPRLLNVSVKITGKYVPGDYQALDLKEDYEIYERTLKL